ncbi:glycosyltransferase [Ochrobactrum sp. A-1]|uniref:glycosyltransferase n=1 Tax=Ochrobactrum sp. A-1 TaxID=2920940 RepID=UPI001F0B3DBE|nr:glycosyltransferase [Ochrobactrum sp. A-1]
MRDKKRVMPIQPSDDDWLNLVKRTQVIDRQQPKIDVIIPVYKGLEETTRCIYSVCEHQQNIPFRIIVINDKSPQNELVEQLEKIAALDLIELYTNEKNLGFVGTVNRGMRLHIDRDVVLLNSDTEVYGNWLDRIYSFAYTDSIIGTVTPLSNNAEICSYPGFVKDNDFELEVDGKTIDKIASKLNSGCGVEAPTAVGFCMFIKRECLSAIGYFDEETFGRGYGEENDFSQRAIAHGYRNIILADTYVRHYGSTSFGADKEVLVKSATAAIELKHPEYNSQVSEFIGSDKLKQFRRNIDLERLKKYRRGKLVLFVSHNRGGGIERHIQDLKKHLEDAGESTVIILRPYGTNFLSVDDLEFPNIGPFKIDGDVSEFANFLRTASVDLVHVHSLVDTIPELSDYLLKSCQLSGVGYDFTVHDYFTICPRVHLIDDHGQYCGEPTIGACESCCSRRGYLNSLGSATVWAWRDRYERFLSAARRVWVPNSDVGNRMKRYFGAISFIVRPHPEPHLPTRNSKSRSILNTNLTTNKIAILGAIGPHKGSKLLLDVARVARRESLNMEFVVIGYTDIDHELETVGNVKVTGPYKDEELDNLIAAESPDIVWMSSVCPETHSYTLSEALYRNLYPVGFNFGAVAERIRYYSFGSTIDIRLMLDPEALCKKLYDMLSECKDARINYVPHRYQLMMDDYYEL